MAATRSLGRVGLRVGAADHTPKLPAAAWKYRWAAGSYPDSASERSRLVPAVVALQVGMAHGVDNPLSPVATACSDATPPPMLEVDAAAGICHVRVPGAAAYDRLSDSWTLFQRARIAALGWCGPVMFEFKGAPAGNWSLVDVNNRLWGSVKLCINCGVALPLAVYRLARGETVVDDDRYNVGRYLNRRRGGLGYQHCVVLRCRGVDPRHPSRLAAVRAFLGLRPGSTAIEESRHVDGPPLIRHVAAEFGR